MSPQIHFGPSVTTVVGSLQRKKHVQNYLWWEEKKHMCDVLNFAPSATFIPFEYKYVT